MKSIGGYFELELQRNQEFHPAAIALNSGRNAFAYVLKAKQYKKVYLPFYTCDVLLQPINTLCLEVEFYQLNENLEPVFDADRIMNGEAFVYTNYFGIKDQFIKKLTQCAENLIIDNSQAFFSAPIDQVDTFYSPRKFFGVSDGAYLYTNVQLPERLEIDQSADRIGHLVKRIEQGAESGYDDFKINDAALDHAAIKTMSAFTNAILSGIDFDRVREIRQRNFLQLHQALQQHNELSVPRSSSCPMVYPFLIKNGNALRQILIEKKIYVARYWLNTAIVSPPGSFEAYLNDNLLPLPIDQRYTIEDMQVIIGIIQKFYGL